MLKVKTVVFTTDLTNISKELLPYACMLAKQFDAELLLLHGLVPDVIAAEPPMIIDTQAEAEEAMRSLQASPMMEGIRHREFVARGVLEEVLEELCQQEGVGLIVAGTHGRGKLEKFLIGSVAERIFRTAKCPVLSIGPRVRKDLLQTARIRRILAATDLGNSAHPAIRFGAELACNREAELTLLTVLPGTTADDRLHQQTVARDALLALVPPELAAHCHPVAIVRQGDVSSKIVESAADQCADLIVVGAHRAKLMTTHLMDTAYKVICQASCPVVTVNSRAIS